MKDTLKGRIKLIPAVGQVLVEYEKIYGKKKAREMFDYMVERILDFIEEEIKRGAKELLEAQAATEYNKVEVRQIPPEEV